MIEIKKDDISRANLAQICTEENSVFKECIDEDEFTPKHYFKEFIIKGQDKDGVTSEGREYQLNKDDYLFMIDVTAHSELSYFVTPKGFIGSFTCISDTGLAFVEIYAVKIMTTR
ncbi:MAG: hypothetical protein RBT59_07065 [Arcobacteraceae bacterium]|jgi:hypothetical protein|nr:hypothetical protein [Arcobacteraceae bacterium]